MVDNLDALKQPGSHQSIEYPRIVPRKHPVRYLTAFVFLVLFAMFINMLVTNPNWGWPTVWHYLFNGQVLAGLRRTIYLTFTASVLGLILGLVILAMRTSGSRLFRTCAALYVWFMRAMPPLVLLLFVFFFGALVPRVGLGIPFGPMFVSVSTNKIMSQFLAATVGLGIYLAAYSSESFRGGVTSVVRGQYDAGRALGMPNSLLITRIVIPQAIRVSIPPLANELINMFKNTSLVTVIGYAELLTTVQLIYARNFETIPLLVVASIWYLALASIGMLIQGRLEKRYGRGYVAR